MPKLLLRLHLFHLKHDLAARVTFLLKFRILALKGEINKRESCLRSVSICWSEICNRYGIRIVEIIIGCKRNKNLVHGMKKFLQKSFIKKHFLPKLNLKVKHFGFNFHLPITTTVEFLLFLYLHSSRLGRSVNFACFSFAMHRIYWNSISKEKNNCGKEKQMIKKGQEALKRKSKWILWNQYLMVELSEDEVAVKRNLYQSNILLAFSFDTFLSIV